MSTEIPSMIAGRYRVIRELGRGGMGAVYLVEHAHTGERLALKVLLANAGADATAVERFKREARAPAKIRSEHVVRVTDADVAQELGGAPFLVMEALDGYDLDKFIEKQGPLSTTQVIWVLRQVATALDKAHAIGVVHRDLKPENLFWHHREEGGPIIKILDFGISKSTAPEMKAAGLTTTGAVMGTPLYMAPEQARGQTAAIGPQTDIWAIGLITVHLLTAQVYWVAETMAELLIKIVVDPMPVLSQRFPQLGTGLDAWFARSCNRDPSQRFGSVGEQIAALAHALGIEYAAPREQHASFAGVQQTLPAASGTTGNPLAASASGAIAAVTAPAASAEVPAAVRNTANAMARSMGDASYEVPKKKGLGLVMLAAAAVFIAGGGAVAWTLRSNGAAADGTAAASASEAAHPITTSAQVTPPPPVTPEPKPEQKPTVTEAPVTSAPTAPSAKAPEPSVAVAPIRPRIPTAAPAKPVVKEPPTPTAVARPATPTATPKTTAPAAPTRFAPVAP